MKNKNVQNDGGTFRFAQETSMNLEKRENYIYTSRTMDSKSYDKREGCWDASGRYHIFITISCVGVLVPFLTAVVKPPHGDGAVIGRCCVLLDTINISNKI